MKRIGLFFVFSILVSFAASAQYVAFKTNLAYDVLTTPNLGIEVSMGRHFTFDIEGGYNPWEFSKQRSTKHWHAVPEVRYWLRERFNGHYIGLYGTYFDYVFKRITIPIGIDKKYGYDGFGYGGGIAYGYQLFLSPRFNMEFTVGAGYTYLEYDKFSMPDGNAESNEYLGLFRTKHWGVNKIGISIVYLLK